MGLDLNRPFKILMFWQVNNVIRDVAHQMRKLKCADTETLELLIYDLKKNVFKKN